MPKQKRFGKKTRNTFATQPRYQVVAFVLIFAAIASFLLWKSFAASGQINVDAPAVAMANAGGDGSYWVTTTDGGVFSMGNATFYGSMGGRTLTQPITSMTARPQHDGYWLLGGDGGVFAFGGANDYGRPEASTITGFYKSIISTPTGNGYWVVSEYGQIAAYGDAVADSGHGSNSINATIARNNTDFGGIPSIVSNQHYILSATRSVSGYGLALLSKDGSVYAYGDMPYRGGANGSNGVDYASGDRTNTIVNDGGDGYIIIANSGAVFAYGAPYLGRTSGNHIVSADYTQDGSGYWLLGIDGSIYAYGNAQYDGRVYASKPSPTPTPPPSSPTSSPPKSNPSPNPTPPPSPTSCSSQTLKMGSSGSCVSTLQTQLNNLIAAKLSVDGQFGPLTQAQVCRYEAGNSMSVNGEVTAPVWAALAAGKKGASGSGCSTSTPPARTPVPGGGTTNLTLDQYKAQMCKEIEQAVNPIYVTFSATAKEEQSSEQFAADRGASSVTDSHRLNIDSTFNATRDASSPIFNFGLVGHQMFGYDGGGIETCNFGSLSSAADVTTVGRLTAPLIQNYESKFHTYVGAVYAYISAINFYLTNVSLRH